MYYINATPSENGNYGNPQSNGRDRMLILPEELLGAYIETMGFATLTVDEGVITEVTVNQAAYDAYQEAHPPMPEPEPDPQPTDAERIAALEEQNAFLMDCLLEMSEIVYA